MSALRRAHRGGRRHPGSAAATPDRWRLWLLGALILGGLAMWTWASTARFGRPAAPEPNSQGLRVSGDGRDDASQVLDPAGFTDSRVRQAYTIARAIPGTLNQLYCWCHCEETLGMRSLLECYESEHATQCEICLGEAELAWRLTQQGTTDPGQIQAAIDEWGAQVEVPQYWGQGAMT